MAVSTRGHLSLCAGIGGIDLSFKVAGIAARTVCYVEREIPKSAVLAARMATPLLDEAPIYSDVGSFDARPWRDAVGIVSGGIPCQPFSYAGSQRGTDDERWLWDPVRSIVRDTRPDGVFLENVPGLVKKGLATILADLAQLGFDAEWDVFSCQGVGAPHIRRRLYVAAWRVSDPDEERLRIQPERGEGSAQAADGGHAGSVAVGADVAHADEAGSQGHERATVPGAGRGSEGGAAPELRTSPLLSLIHI